MKRILTAKLSRDRHEKPLVIIESALGNGMEICPDRLRALAGLLVDIAERAEAVDSKDKYFRESKVELDF